MKHLSAVAFFCTAISLISSCHHVDGTGRRSINMLSATEENQMGVQAFEQYKSKMKVSTDAEVNAQVQRVAERLKKVIKLEGAAWEFVVFDNSEPNAFALPGGKVGVHTGILIITENDAGLAAVVGHEIGHVVARHGGERASHGMLAQAGSAVLGGILGATGKMSSTSIGAIQQAYGIGAQVGALLPFSRKQELEADKLGALYMAKAGYDPQEAVNLWVRFSKYKAEKGASAPKFMSTHPSDEKRIEELREFMPEAKKHYTASL